MHASLKYFHLNQGDYIGLLDSALSNWRRRSTVLQNILSTLSEDILYGSLYSRFYTECGDDVIAITAIC